MATFSAQVKNWQTKTEETLRKIAATAIQDQLSRMQTPVAQGGNMPVDTSTLRNSLVSELNGAAVGKGPDSYVLAIAGMELGDTVTASWTAEYAAIRHYKPEDFGQGGGMWRDKSMQYWQSDVDAAANRFKT
ncbi:MAG: hypothetical protein ACRCYS_20435 [Beijerinckiaceae bacterium]